MRVSRLKKAFVAVVVVCGLLAFVIGRAGGPDFRVRWRNLKDGMTEPEVKRLLGAPTHVGTTSFQGAGGKPVTRWEYETGRASYYVDFDYIGPGGAPVVYRTERSKGQWWWERWLPW